MARAGPVREKSRRTWCLVVGVCTGGHQAAADAKASDSTLAIGAKQQLVVNEALERLVKPAG